ADVHMVKLWVTATGNEVRTLGGHAGLITRVTFSPDGRALAVACSDSTVKLWDTATGNELQTLRRHRTLGCRVAYIADGRILASPGSRDLVQLGDAATGKDVGTPRGGSAGVRGRVISPYDSAAFSPDGRALAVASTNTVQLWDTATWKEVRTL